MGTSGSQANQQPVAADSRLFFRVNDRVTAYDPKTKETTELTSDVPAKATMVDFYADTSTWRAYYVDYTQSPQKLSFLEKDKEAAVVATGETDTGIYAIADAKAKVAAYSLTPSFAEGQPRVIRTFLVKNNAKPEEVYKSNEGDLTKPNQASDAKSYLYTVSGVSKDASKLLFGYHTCYQCDGPPLATAFELDLETKPQS